MPDRATIQRGMTLSLERKIQIGFGIAVAIIVAVGAAALRSTTATVESALWMAHTLEARRELEATFADLITAETAVRGFVITGDTTYLGPYHTARSTLGGLLAGLRTLTADNPAQQRRLDSLRTLVDAAAPGCPDASRSEEHTSELQSLAYLVCRLLLEKKKNNYVT